MDQVFTDGRSLSQSISPFRKQLLWENIYQCQQSSDWTSEAAHPKDFDVFRFRISDSANAGDLPPVILGLTPTEYYTNSRG